MGDAIHEWGLPFRCKICPDSQGEQADLMAFDVAPEHAVDDTEGFNTVIVRTGRGLTLLRRAEEAGALNVTCDLRVDSLHEWQAHIVRRRIGAGPPRRHHAEERGGPKGERLSTGTRRAARRPRRLRPQCLGRLATGRRRPRDDSLLTRLKETIVRRILIIEPVAWSEEIDTARPYLESLKEADTVLDSAWVEGLAAIEAAVDEMRCAPLVVDVVEARAAEYDAMAIDCFADPGLRAAREIARIPIVGAAEASLCLALQLGQRIGVVSPSSLAAKDAQYMAGAYGLSSRLAGAVGVDIPIVDLEKDPEATTAALVEAARTSVGVAPGSRTSRAAPRLSERSGRPMPSTSWR